MPGSIANGYSTATMGGLIDQLREDFPNVVGTRFQATYADVVRRGSATSVAFAYVDPNFLDVVRLPMLQGDLQRALGAPGKVLINQTTAKRYYPAGHAIGQMITLTVMGKTANYRIAGIFHDLPPNTELNYAMLAKMPNPHPDRNWFHWGSERVWTILRFSTPHDAARLQQRMRAFVIAAQVKIRGLLPRH